ncbi:hypothetical protein BV379_04945 [Rhodovulum sulfidophilum]|nr:hypothetical protein BV379_04945 [Rhodovulum sulfidophilum]
MLMRALVECTSDKAFASLHRLLMTCAHLFACHDSVRQMLETCHGQITALAELGEFSDIAEGRTTRPADDARAPLTDACLPNRLAAPCTRALRARHGPAFLGGLRYEHRSARFPRPYPSPTRSGRLADP